MTYGLQDLPAFPTPDGMNADEYLASLCQTAVADRLSGVPPRAGELLAYELSVIRQSKLSNYFLIVWDIVRFAREQDILCQGRGSAANSLVAFLLDISPINPLAHDLVFERFLSPERTSVPDIDIDFAAGDAREKVIQYVYERWGHDHTAMACTFVTFQKRMARREIGKVLGVPIEMLEEKATLLPPEQRTSTPAWTQYESLCQQIIDFPRHLSIHNGGMIISREPLAQRLPTEPATMPGRFVVQWDKAALEDVGIVKIDILGLRMLSAIARTTRTLAERTGRVIDLAGLSPSDPSIYEMMAQADAVGIFQVESRAQAQVLPVLVPRNYGDIVVTISLIRPGPVMGNMVHPYLRRRVGIEPISYAHAVLEPALAETLGIVLWQEQVLRVAKAMGQFTPGQGELLRRALGGKGGVAAVEKFQTAFIAGAEGQGISYETAAHVFEQLKAFGSYSFPKSHAAAFAVIVYQSAYLKHYHTAAYLCAILNEQPMGFWSPAVIVNDARRHGITVLPVSIHHSQAECMLEGENIRLGLRYVAYLTERQIEAIITAREEHTFRDLPDLLRRVTLPRAIVENLILIGAMDGWGIPRRQLLWELGERFTRVGELPLDFYTHTIDLPPLSRQEMLQAEYTVLGLSPGDHPMSLYQEMTQIRNILGSKQLMAAQHGAIVRIAGQIVMHQAPPTAKNHHFVTLEDSDGMMNVVVRPDVVTQTNKVPFQNGDGLNGATLVVVEGTVQRQGEVVNVVAERILPLKPRYHKR
jgi:error-prone DNA polymerase